MKQSELDPIIEAIIKDYTRPMIDLTVTEIAEEVFKRTNGQYMPSTSIVKYALTRIGVDNDGHKARRWAWRHNAGHE